jgi:uncharacterized protein (TIGR00369 family)
MMPSFQPKDPNFERRMRDSFPLQRLMMTIGAKMGRAEPGEVEIEVDYREDITQPNGYLHGGTLAAIADTACGYAAFTLVGKEQVILTAEFKINFIAPAVGERFIAKGRVLKPGQTLTACVADVVAIDAQGAEKLVAAAQATIMTIEARANF